MTFRRSNDNFIIKGGLREERLILRKSLDKIQFKDIQFIIGEKTMKKVTILFLMGIMLFIQLLFNVDTINASNIPQKELSLQTDEEYSDDGYDINYSRNWTKLVWWISNKAGNFIYQRQPTRQVGPNWDTISSGTISFNSGNYGTSTRHTVSVQHRDHEIDTWPQTSVVNWASKISVIITNPSNTDVRSRSVTHNQHTYYKGGRNGTYTVRYAQRSKQSWDIWLRLFHWTGSCSIPPCPIPTGAETAAELKDGDVTTITNLETNKEYKAMQIEGGFYVLPSKSHLANNTAFKDEKTFTLSSLQNRAFDTELGVLVRNFKGLSIGDKITLEDEIKLIRYDKDLDETFLVLKSSVVLSQNGHSMET